MSELTNPVIDRLREARKLRELRIKQVAQEVWASFDENERTAVRFGMFPAGKTQEAEKKLVLEFADSPRDTREVGKDLCVAIMDCATKDGGMRA